MYPIFKKYLFVVLFVFIALLIIRTPYSFADLALSWTFPTGGEVTSSPAIGADGTVYVGALDSNGSLDSYLYAINPDGTRKWAFPTDGIVTSSPAIGSDSTIYVGSGEGYVYAINPDGTRKWAPPYHTGGEVNSSPAIGADGVIYVGSLDSYLYAINPEDPIPAKWTFETGGEVNSPAIGGDGTIYVGSRDGNLYAINPEDGIQKWAFETEDEVISSPAIGSDGTIYVGSTDKKLYAINPEDGIKKWDFETGGEVISSPAIGSDGTIYVGSKDCYLYAINPEDGSEKWKFETGDWVTSSPAIGADGVIYVGSLDTYLYAINPEDGTKKWAFKTGGELESSPAIGNDGVIYVGSDDYNLYAISGSSCGIADSAWPMFHHGLRHSGVATNAPPNKPVLSSPSDGATDLPLTPTLQTQEFSDPDIGDTHIQSRWQISTVSDFSSLIINTTSLLHLTTLSVPTFALQGQMTYYWRVRFYDNFYSPSQWSDVRSFTTQAATGDEINPNGIPDVQENDTVDMNGDKTPDIKQTDKIKSLNTVVGNGKMGISRFGEEPKVEAIVSVESIDPDTISQIARPYNMHLGVFAARLKVKNPGDSVEVQVYLSEPAPDGAKWFVYDSIHGWHDYSAYATFSPDRKSVIVKLRDGGYGDADGVENGIIVDPFGPGLPSWVGGCVRDAQTRKIISTAEVTFKSATSGEVETCKPIYGLYRTSLCPDRYKVTASAPGYLKKTDSIEIHDGFEVLEKDFQLNLCDSVDSDSDGTNDCDDNCPNDPYKIAPGMCGCGVADSDCEAKPPVVKTLKVSGGSKVNTFDMSLEAGIKGMATKYKVWEGPQEPTGWTMLPETNVPDMYMIPVKLKQIVPGDKTLGVKRTLHLKAEFYGYESKIKKVSVSLVVPKASGLKVNGNNKSGPNDNVPVSFKASEDAIYYYISGKQNFDGVGPKLISGLEVGTKGGYIAPFDLSGVKESVKGKTKNKRVYLKVSNKVCESKVVKADVKMVGE